MFAAGGSARPPDPYPPSSHAPLAVSSGCIYAYANWTATAASSPSSRAYPLRHFRFASGPDQPVAC